ncbi:hypothetical protein ACTQWG_06795 [Blautia sp. HCP3S3_H10_1]|uniref:hypothetical protein n=1 Tax=unclassified Blautia TaxID=2648079 RepID=UPI003F8F0950|nr:hypothetical protein [Clostridia bacterium]
MRKNTLKKAMAVIISAAMMTTGYAMVSAEDFTDAETLAEMDAFTGAAEAEITEAQPEAAQTPEAQPEAVQETAQPEASQTEEFQGTEAYTEDQAFLDGFSDGSADDEMNAFTDGTESEEETVAPAAAADFRFENDEVIITAKVFDETAIPENTVMNAVKLEAGSEKYEEAKQASIRDLGTKEDDEYTFYDVTFTVDGVEIEIPDEAVVISMEFKTAAEENTSQSALHIQETEEGVVAQDVTAQSTDGSLKSVGFNF